MSDVLGSGATDAAPEPDRGEAEPEEALNDDGADGERRPAPGRPSGAGAALVAAGAATAPA